MWQGPSAQAWLNSHPREAVFLDPADQMLCLLDIQDPMSLGDRGGWLSFRISLHPRQALLVNFHRAAPRSLIRFEPPLSCVHVAVSAPSPGMPGFRANCLFTRLSVLGGGPEGTASEQITTSPLSLEPDGKNHFYPDKPLSHVCPDEGSKHRSQSLANLRSVLVLGPF